MHGPGVMSRAPPPAKGVFPGAGPSFPITSEVVVAVNPNPADRKYFFQSGELITELDCILLPASSF